MGHDCDKKKHDHHHEHRGPRGKRGHRGHDGHRGFPGPTGASGPTGPCCTGPTGPAAEASCQSLFKRIEQETCTQDFENYDDLLCLCLNASKASLLNFLVSLSTQISGNDSPEVSYQILLDGTPIPGSHAGAGGVAGTGGFYGNAIIVQQAVAPGQHTICLQWRVTGGNMSACIDPNDANHGMHASLLVESCDGISLCIQ